MQGPAIANHMGWFARILNRQAARTIHFWRAVLVSVFHLRPCDAGVHHGGATKFELHVGRCERQFLDGFLILGLRYGPGDRDVVGLLRLSRSGIARLVQRIGTNRGAPLAYRELGTGTQ